MNREILTEIALAAGDAIMSVRGDDLKVTKKQDMSPATEADLLANEIITKRLTDAYPEIPIVSEEGQTQTTANRFWLVDPLDGTKEFIDGRYDFTVNIALIENHRPVMGIVHLPLAGDIFYGDSEGALKTHNGNTFPIQISGRVNELRVVTSRHHMDSKTLEFLETINPGNVNQLGSSFKFCQIAEGSAEVYPRFAKTMEWDTAAGQAVLEAAGGVVHIASTGEVLNYGKPGFENPGFIALSETAVLGNLA